LRRITAMNCCCSVGCMPSDRTGLRAVNAGVRRKGRADFWGVRSEFGRGGWVAPERGRQRGRQRAGRVVRGNPGAAPLSFRRNRISCARAGLFGNQPNQWLGGRDQEPEVKR
jgi:hypothetical protein